MSNPLGKVPEHLKHLMAQVDSSNSEKGKLDADGGGVRLTHYAKDKNELAESTTKGRRIDLAQYGDTAQKRLEHIIQHPYVIGDVLSTGITIPQLALSLCMTTTAFLALVTEHDMEEYVSEGQIAAARMFAQNVNQVIEDVDIGEKEFASLDKLREQQMSLEIDIAFYSNRLSRELDKERTQAVQLLLDEAKSNAFKIGLDIDRLTATVDDKKPLYMNRLRKSKILSDNYKWLASSYDKTLYAPPKADNNVKGGVQQVSIQIDTTGQTMPTSQGTVVEAQTGVAVDDKALATGTIIVDP